MRLASHWSADFLAVTLGVRKVYERSARRIVLIGTVARIGEAAQRRRGFTRPAATVAGIVPWADRRVLQGSYRARVAGWGRRPPALFATSFRHP